MPLFKNVPISIPRTSLGWMVSALKFFLCLCDNVRICYIAIVMETNEIFKRHLHARSQGAYLCTRPSSSELTPTVLFMCLPIVLFLLTLLYSPVVFVELDTPGHSSEQMVFVRGVHHASFFR